MPEPTAKDAAETQDHGSARGLRLLITLLASILVPAAIYTFYVLGQLEQVREHNLRGLESTAQAVAGLLENTRATVDNLVRDPGYACLFFERQKRLTLVAPSCSELTEIFAGKRGAFSKDELHLVETGVVEIVGEIPLKAGAAAKGCVTTATTDTKPAQKLDSTTAASDKERVCPFRIEVKLDTLLEQIPFGAVFDRLMIVNEAGELLGSAISPQRSSPMLPPDFPAASSSPPVRALDLASLKYVGNTKDSPVTFKGFGRSTLVHPVILGGVRYSLMCQPWRVAANGRTTVQTWRLCGFIDSQRSFQQALDVAPQFIILLLVLFTVAVVSWPMLKALSIAPRERIRFADMFLMLLATLALVMLFAVGVADLGTYARLRDQSHARLEALAKQIESNLRAEFAQMYEQLGRYDTQIAAISERDDEQRRFDSALKANAPIRVACLLLPSDQKSRHDCQRDEIQLAVPQAYEHFQSIFWMRPCDGQQFIKGTVLLRNTPAISTSNRAYFQAIKHDRFWTVAQPGTKDADRPSTPPARFFVDTDSSITTGEFFAALSIPSILEKTADRNALAPDCTAQEADRFGAALSGQLVSMHRPILAPGIGFAIVDQDGTVRFHSDERRAVFENLLKDEGLATRLRAVLATGTDAKFRAHYQTRPHQIHVHSMHDIPWSIVTFADDEILRTLHVELLAQTAILITLYLLLAFIGVLIYILFHGREPPPWVWPRRGEEYRVLYSTMVWSLCAQLILFMLALDVLRGEILVLASLILPLPGLLTVLLAARAARRLNARPPAGVTHDMHRAAIVVGLRRGIALLIVLAVALFVAANVTMRHYYPVTAAQVDTGTETGMLGVLLVIVIVAGAIAERAGRRQRSQPHESAAGQNRWLGWWRDPLGPHILGTLIVWLLLGALPAYGLYKFALANQMTVVTKAEQAYFGRAFAWRACKTQEEFRLIPTANSDTPDRHTQVQPIGKARPNPDYSGIYPSALLSRSAGVSGGQPNSGAADDLAIGHPFWEYLATLAPVYNETTTYSRYLGTIVSPRTDSGPPAGSRWTWQLSPTRKPVLTYQHDHAGACNAQMPAIANQLPMLEPHFGWSGFLFALGFLSLLIAWVVYGARRLFFGDIEDEAQRTDGTLPSSNEPTLTLRPGRLELRPDRAWVEAEVAAISDATVRFSDETLNEWCRRQTRRTVVDHILDKVHAVYDGKWQKCTEEERLVLIQLVEEGFANPRQIEIVRKLLKRGLLRRDPVLRTMSDSFALFVQGCAQPENVRHQETVHSGLRWSLVRAVLIGALLLILVFLSFTQRDVVEVWIAYLGTAAAGAVGVMKLFSLLSRSGSPKLD